MANQKPSNGISEDTKTLITVLLLIFVFPIGIILMWVWMKWTVWVKILLTIIAIIPLIIIIGAVSAFLLLLIIPTDINKKVHDAVRIKDLVSLHRSIDLAINTNPSNNFLCNGKIGSCVGDSTDQNLNVKKTDGTGWVKIRLDSLSVLPVDPINNANYSYTYCSDGKDWEIQVRMESKEALEKAKNDGGDEDDQYEVGTNLKLCQ